MTDDQWDYLSESITTNDEQIICKTFSPASIASSIASASFPRSLTLAANIMIRIVDCQSRQKVPVEKSLGSIRTPGSGRRDSVWLHSGSESSSLCFLRSIVDSGIPVMLPVSHRSCEFFPNETEGNPK